MRLINTYTSKLENFPGKPPKYAILSHTWGDGEVLFQDVADLERARSLAGYDKIATTCRLARQAEIPYAWVDTCCIDKTSSAELSEAINSMYRWYAGAEVTIAYLSDWLPEVNSGTTTAKPHGDKVRELKDSRWFRRGWTLQELIAPAKLELYDSFWQRRGTKLEMSTELAKITRVDEDLLRGTKSLKSFPVAVRMSWAAGRETTREEDVAYSLLGIFDVNMPMLYGEGKKAFLRLQEAVLAEVNDLTLFAWAARDREQDFRGVFARDPGEFEGAAGIRSLTAPRFGEEISTTNKGVKMSARVTSDNSVISLNCADGQAILGLHLKKYGSSQYVRARPWKFGDGYVTKGWFEYKLMYICKDLSKEDSDEMAATRDRRGDILFPLGLDVRHYKAVDFEPARLWDEQYNHFLGGGDNTITFTIKFEAKECTCCSTSRKPFWLHLRNRGPYVRPNVLLTKDESLCEYPFLDPKSIKSCTVRGSSIHARLEMAGDDGLEDSIIVLNVRLDTFTGHTTEAGISDMSYYHEVFLSSYKKVFASLMRRATTVFKSGDFDEAFVDSFYEDDNDEPSGGVDDLDNETS